MPRSLPPLNALRAFEAAGRHESFSKAAEELGVAHSAVSRHVRGLEDHLGAQLFRDLPRGVALTEVGARYLAWVSPAFDRIAEASEIFAAAPAGRIAVDSEGLFAAKWLIPRLGDFYARYPDIELRLDATRSLADLGRYQADLAIRYFNEGQPDAAEPLISNRAMYPYCTPALMGDGFERPEDLLRHPLLRDRADNTWEPWFRLAGGDASLLPEGRWRMRATLALEAALAGQGVILVTQELVERDVAAGRLVKAMDVPYRKGSYHMVFAEGVQRRKPVRAFRDWLLEQSRDLRDT